MQTDTKEPTPSQTIHISDDVRSYILKRKRDFRVSTACNGPILLPTSLKPPKPTDLQVQVGDYTLYISKYQVRYIDTMHKGVIHKGMIPIFFDDF
jgi:hypothetical protein